MQCVRCELNILFLLSFERCNFMTSIIFKASPLLAMYCWVMFSMNISPFADILIFNWGEVWGAIKSRNFSWNISKHERVIDASFTLAAVFMRWMMYATVRGRSPIWVGFVSPSLPNIKWVLPEPVCP